MVHRNFDHQQDLGNTWPHARTHWLRGSTCQWDQRQERTHSNKIEIKMLEDPDEKEWIEQRDKRRPTGKAISSTSAAPEVLHATGRDQQEEATHDDGLMNEDGGSADTSDGVPELSPEDVEVGVEADEEHDILYDPKLNNQRPPG